VRREQGVFAGAAARIENRADDLIGGGLERRRGLPMSQGGLPA